LSIPEFIIGYASPNDAPNYEVIGGEVIAGNKLKSIKTTITNSFSYNFYFHFYFSGNSRVVTFRRTNGQTLSVTIRNGRYAFYFENNYYETNISYNSGDFVVVQKDGYKFYLYINNVRAQINDKRLIGISRVDNWVSFKQFIFYTPQYVDFYNCTIWGVYESRERFNSCNWRERTLTSLPDFKYSADEVNNGEGTTKIKIKGDGYIYFDRRGILSYGHIVKSVPNTPVVFQAYAKS